MIDVENYEKVSYSTQAWIVNATVRENIILHKDYEENL